MKKALLLSLALLSLLSACEPAKPMSEEDRQRLLKDMQQSQAYR